MMPGLMAPELQVSRNFSQTVLSGRGSGRQTVRPCQYFSTVMRPLGQHQQGLMKLMKWVTGIWSAPSPQLHMLQNKPIQETPQYFHNLYNSPGSATLDGCSPLRLNWKHNAKMVMSGVEQQIDGGKAGSFTIVMHSISRCADCVWRASPRHHVLPGLIREEDNFK